MAISRRATVSRMSSAAKTVTYRGVNDVALVADEWNRGSAQPTGGPRF